VSESDTLGLFLAGGRGTRMGGVDKASIRLGNETLIERGIARARPQVNELLINANGDVARFAHFGLPVISDSIGGFLGPLAGILSGLEWMRANRPRLSWLATFACDCPFFPRDMVEKLLQGAEAERALVAIAASGERHHPVFAIWNAALPVSSQGVLDGQGSRKMDDFVARFPNTRVIFPSDPIDPFFNINTPADLAHAETLLQAPEREL
jgi:molybdenum cofactor guanylyltransferase